MKREKPQKMFDDCDRPSKKARTLHYLIEGKRGSRFEGMFVCHNCNVTFSSGWKYQTEDKEILLCSLCKAQIKPTKFRPLLYTPMGNDPKRK